MWSNGAHDSHCRRFVLSSRDSLLDGGFRDSWPNVTSVYMGHNVRRIYDTHEAMDMTYSPPNPPLPSRFAAQNQKPDAQLSVCRNCGAPILNTTSPQCQYCGADLVHEAGKVQRIIRKLMSRHTHVKAN